MKMDLEQYNYSKKSFRDIKNTKFLKEGILIAVGFVFLVLVLIFTN